MTATVTGTSLTAKVRYDIEPDFDYAFLGRHGRWRRGRPSTTNLSTTTRPERQQPQPHRDHRRLTGLRRSGAWVDLTATLPAGTTAVQLRATPPTARPCSVRASGRLRRGRRHGRARLRAGRSTGSRRRSTGVEQSTSSTPTSLENRQYDGYDASLRTAYNFGFLNTRPDWVETYPYQNGLLVSYWNEPVRRQQRRRPPGGRPDPARSTPHPTFHHWPNGDLMRQRILAYDSTFGTEKTDAITLHNNSRCGDHPVAEGRSDLRRHQGLVVQRRPARGHRQPTRVATSRAGRASTCRRPARRSPSTVPRPAAT